MFSNPIDTKDQSTPPAQENLQKYESLSQERKRLQEHGDLPA